MGESRRAWEPRREAHYRRDKKEETSPSEENDVNWEVCRSNYAGGQEGGMLRLVFFLAPQRLYGCSYGSLLHSPLFSIFLYDQFPYLEGADGIKI
jgi:hypothetical protein